jgi:hypothetical protein
MLNMETATSPEMLVITVLHSNIRQTFPYFSLSENAKWLRGRVIHMGLIKQVTCTEQAFMCISL